MKFSPWKGGAGGGKKNPKTGGILKPHKEGVKKNSMGLKHPYHENGGSRADSRGESEGQAYDVEKKNRGTKGQGYWGILGGGR